MKALRTIRFRLTAWYALMVLVLVGGVVVFTILRLQNHTLRQIDRELKAKLGKTEALAAESNYLEELQEEADSAGRSGNGYYALYDRQGELMLHSPNFSPPQKIDYAGADSLCEGERRYDWAELSNGTRVRRITAALKDPVGGKSGCILQISVLTAHDALVVENLVENLLFFVPVILILAVLGGMYLARAGLRPMEALSERAAEISERHMGMRLPLRGVDDEIDRHAAAMNKMLARLEDAFNEARNFAARSSHELRTPLTALRLEIERALARAGADAELTVTLESAVAEAERLSTLVDKLLFLTRMQAEELEVAFREVDLSAVLGEVADDADAVAGQVGVKVSCAIEPRVTIRGDEILLRHLVWNVLQNAVKFSPAGGEITVKLNAEQGYAHIVISDQGPGMDTATLGRVFEPFYRGDSPQPADRREGFGLGLNIANWVCKKHSGLIEIQSQPGRGTTVSAHIPLSGNRRKLENSN